MAQAHTAGRRDQSRRDPQAGGAREGDRHRALGVGARRRHGLGGQEAAPDQGAGARPPQPRHREVRRLHRQEGGRDGRGSARRVDGRRGQGLQGRRAGGRGDPPPPLHRGPGPHRGAVGEAGALPAHPRGRAREGLQRIHRPGRRGGQRHGQALRARRHHRRPRPHRGDRAALRAGPPRALQPGRAHPRRDHRGPQAAQGAADRAVAHRPAAPGQALRDGGAGDLRRHGGDQDRGARPGRARQGGGLQPRARRRPGGRLRRHEGLARAGDHPRAARREDRHHPVVGRPGHLRPVGAGAGQDHPRLGHPPRRGAAPRRHRRGRAALAGDRQARPERAPGLRADRRQDRHQERVRRQGRGGGGARPHARVGGDRAAAGRPVGRARPHHRAGHRRQDRARSSRRRASGSSRRCSRRARRTCSRSRASVPRRRSRSSTGRPSSRPSASAPSRRWPTAAPRPRRLRPRRPPRRWATRTS